MDTLFTKELRQRVVKQLILLLLFLSQFSFAEPVHRWQDQQGHWHYGDGAASNTFHGKTVAINTPISIVKNEHAQQHIDVEKATISRAPRLKTIHHKKTSLSDQHKIYCNDMRDKIHRTELSMDDMAQRQILLNTYEQQCIHGH